MQPQQPLLITLTGATCSGKTTAMRYLISRHGFMEVLSFTTRPPRHGEVWGKDYRFVGLDEAQRYIDQGDAIEHVRQGEHLYGILRDDFDRAIRHGLAAVIVNPHGLPPMLRAAEHAGARVLSVTLDAPPAALMRRLITRAVADGPAALNRHLDRVNRIYREELEWGNDVFRMEEVANVLEITSGDDVSPAEIASMIAVASGVSESDTGLGENAL